MDFVFPAAVVLLLLGVVEVARKAALAHGPTLDRYRSFVPLALLLDWIARETNWFRFTVSRDPVLIEVSFAQAPLARAYRLDVDPFDPVGSCWLACREAIDDGLFWRGGGVRRGEEPEAWQDDLVEWLAAGGADLWYVVQMDYSVGSGALRRILRSTLQRAMAASRGPADRGLMAEVLDWERNTDLAAPALARAWGRQSPAIVSKRIRKHAVWVRDAAKIGPLDGPAGGTPPEARPLGVPAFPAALVAAARVCAAAGKGATREEHAAAHAQVRSYARARARREMGRIKAGYWEFRNVLRSLRKPEVTEPVERGD